jgi:hypothetical protein
MGVFSLCKYKGSKGMDIRNVWKWKIILKYNENIDIHPPYEGSCSFSWSDLSLYFVDVVILAQRAMQGCDNIGFLAPSHLLLFSQFGASLGYFLLLVTSFTATILHSIVSIGPCCKGLQKWYHQMVSPWLE